MIGKDFFLGTAASNLNGILADLEAGLGSREALLEEYKFNIGLIREMGLPEAVERYEGLFQPYTH